ncbi:nucleotidyltransferase domain-containing protein [Salinibacter sp. 10B]|uniref:nucleotidyltransferase domain-containing protein n=1 Tax=Salinibacter sp. 10B TaxID=1923971 RepID=UPI0011AFEF3B|nr:nucleotidyltransferase domain-containing protein [Salinibacter sp. 10B]
MYSDRLKKLIVYGSHARGEARPNNDMDLTDSRWIGVIVLKGKVHPDEKARRTTIAHTDW